MTFSLFFNINIILSANSAILFSSKIIQVFQFSTAFANSQTFVTITDL
ncbi:MAG: hypothetical protein LBQ24_02085 [Candidatus Peribacteria bacterium]|nr:hypothetical protein [Candidatus Peribacteria bacterium]